MHLSKVEVKTHWQVTTIAHGPPVGNKVQLKNDVDATVAEEDTLAAIPACASQVTIDLSLPMERLD